VGGNGSLYKSKYYLPLSNKPDAPNFSQNMESFPFGSSDHICSFSRPNYPHSPRPFCHVFLLPRYFFFLFSLVRLLNQCEQTSTVILRRTCKEGYLSFIHRIIWIWKMELPWLESRITTSTPA
jgi:hypothetical protein